MGDPGVDSQDVRRLVPRTDRVLADPRLAAERDRLGATVVKRAVTAAQEQVRQGRIDPDAVVDTARALLPPAATSLRPVINATGVLLHTNLGRAPLSAAAVEALGQAAGTTDLELDLATGRRSGRGAGVAAALLDAVPTAGAAHVVNNGAAALYLCAAVLAQDREIVISRGELVEIGDGFRIPELLEAAGTRLREVGTTNRTSLRDYSDAVGPDTAFVLKVHPSNFVLSGFTSAVPVGELSGLGVPLVVDIGSGLLAPHPALPGEPDAATVLRHGADVVTASADKLLGGPQGGLLLGREDIVHRLRRHPIARAVRVDKLTLAALEATLIGPASPTRSALGAGEDELRARAEKITAVLASQGVDAAARPATAAVGGGGAPGVTLPSHAVALPPDYADALRGAEPPVVGHLDQQQCLLNLRSVPPDQDERLIAAVLSVRPR
ncbi:MAG: L-seryl-tRNA(Sec) selenium transferase [Actinomycetota bacterium]